LTASPKAPKAVESPSATEKKASVPGVKQEEPPPADTPPKPGPASQTEPAEKKGTPQKAEVSTPPKKKAPKPRRQTEAPPVPKVESPSKRKLAAVVRTGGYSVQVGACKTPRCVQRFLENVKKAGFTPHTKKSANRKLTLIRVGSYKTVAETSPPFSG
jgi:hypothetical protein